MAPAAIRPESWHAGGVAAESARWLTVPDLVEMLDLSPGKVHRLIEDHHLLADDGFTDDEAMDWMLEVNELLGVSPIAALRAGRKAEVRRVAQALAF